MNGENNGMLNQIMFSPGKDDFSLRGFLRENPGAIHPKLTTHNQDATAPYSNE
jgi:hypothetical protein